MIRLPHVVTLVRAGNRTDGYGDARPNWASSTRTVTRGYVQPLTSASELPTPTRDAIVTSWLLYLPPKTQLSALDRVEWQGVTYEIDGAPALPDRRGFLQARLRRVEG